VLKAAQIATTEPGPDAGKRIHQRHFVQGMEEVIAGTSVMGQSLFEENGTGPAGLVEQMSEGQEELRGELALLGERLDRLEGRQAKAVEQLEQRQAAALSAQGEAARAALAAASAGARAQLRVAWLAAGIAVVLAVTAIVLVLVRQG
jgi:hypothetical protein